RALPMLRVAVGTANQGCDNNAPGLLLEICLAPALTPVALHYTDTASPRYRPHPAHRARLPEQSPPCWPARSGGIPDATGSRGMVDLHRPRSPATEDRPVPPCLAGRNCRPLATTLTHIPPGSPVHTAAHWLTTVTWAGAPEDRPKASTPGGGERR
ncbi:MAG: hypothetical protein LC799_35000, partial [Actinobacteria bacterium]|nr:hypothetical protein [Actinomycetota bacterium]